MEIQTTRFGRLEIAAGDVIRFAGGLPGLNECTSWVLLADAHNDELGWLQSVDQEDVALAVVSPRRFVPEYELRVGRGELGETFCDSTEELHVLSIVSTSELGLTLNLKAPLVIHLKKGIGRQVISNGDHPVRYPLASQPATVKKAA